MNSLDLCHVGGSYPPLRLLYNLLYHLLVNVRHDALADLLAPLPLPHHLLDRQPYTLHLHLLLAKFHRARIILVPQPRLVGQAGPFLEYYVFGGGAERVLHQPFLGGERALGHGGLALQLLLPLLPENLGPEVHLTLLLGLVKGRPLAHAEGLELVPFHEFGDCRIDEDELAEDICDVELAGDLIAGLIVGLDPGPVGVEPQQVEEGLQVGEQEEAEVVGSGGDFFAIVGEQDLAGKADLVGSLGVGAHYEDEADDGADQPAHVRKIGIQLVEGPLVGDRLGRLPEYNLSVGMGRGFDVGGGSHGFRDMGDGLGLNILKRQQAKISVNGVLLDVGKALNSQLRAKPEQILIGHVELLVGGTVGVDVGVDRGDGQGEVALTRLQGCKSGVIQASRVGCCVTPVYGQFEVLVGGSRQFAFDRECVAQGRTQGPAHAHPVEICFYVP